LLTAALVAAPDSAHAGRTFYGWLYGSEVMPERGVELQSWITEQNFEGREYNEWLFSAQVGITDQLELGLPLEFEWFRDPSMTPPAGTRFAEYGIEARYRFVTQDPVDAPAFVPLVRVGVMRPITERRIVQPEIDLVLSYETGVVQLLVDLGFYAELDVGDNGGNEFVFRPGAGVSVLVAPDQDLRLGAEVMAEIGEGDEWVIAGPNLAWTHGRFWISGAFGIGLNQSVINTAPRVQWGIAF
jgi:hypothetical protein